MLASHRSFVVPELAASLSTTALVHTGYRLHAVQNTGVVCEDDLMLRAFDRRGALGRPVLSIVLRGRARLRSPELGTRWLEPGDVAILPDKGGLAMRQEGPCYESLALEWEPGTLGARPSAATWGRLDARAVARVAHAVRALTPSRGIVPEAPSVALAELLSVLRSEGLPLSPAVAPDLVESVPVEVARLGRVLDHVLSRLDERPMAVDLHATLGMSARTAARVIPAFNARFGFNAAGWRDTLNRRRLMVGASLMTAPLATTETVSARLGYSSPTAFCRAMAAVGFPSPGETARAVARLA